MPGITNKNVRKEIFVIFWTFNKNNALVIAYGNYVVLKIERAAYPHRTKYNCTFINLKVIRI